SGPRHSSTTCGTRSARPAGTASRCARSTGSRPERSTWPSAWSGLECCDGSTSFPSEPERQARAASSYSNDHLGGYARVGNPVLSLVSQLVVAAQHIPDTSTAGALGRRAHADRNTPSARPASPWAPAALRGVLPRRADREEPSDRDPQGAGVHQPRT